MPDFRPHHRITRETAAKLNALADTVSALAHLGEGQLGVDGQQPDLPQIYPLARITGRIVASGDYLFVYTCQIVQPVSVDDTHLKPLVGDVDGFSVEVAYEESNNGHVPCDGSVIVQLRPQVDGRWLFTYQDELVDAVLGTEGADGKYAWQEVRQDSAGGGFTTFSGGRSGSETLNFAQEINHGTGLEGRYVYLQRGFCSGYPQVLVDINTVGEGSTNQVQSVRIVRAYSGTFTLSFFDGSTSETTAPIAFDAAAAAVEAALEALGNITDVDVSGTGTDADPFLVAFLDSFTNYSLLIPSGNALGSDQEYSFDGSVGPEGPIGPAGPSSMIPGPRGAKGQDGQDGRPGQRGSKGDTGRRGPIGAGLRGPKGGDGNDGRNGRTGTKGDRGLQGDFGGALSFELIFDGVTTTSGDPGSGKFLFTATTTCISNTDVYGTNYAAAFTDLATYGGHIRFVAKSDPSRFRAYLASVVTNNGTHQQIVLGAITSSSGALVDAEHVILCIQPRASSTASPLTTAGDIWVYGASGNGRFPIGSTNGWVLTVDLTQSFKMRWALVTGTGTVTSVGLSMPSIFTVTGSPVTAAGTLTATLNTVTAHFVLIGPTGGGPSVPTMRLLVTSDFTDQIITYAKIQNVSAASRLLGRGSAAGAGVVQEITLGTGLTMTNQVLSVNFSAGGGAGKDFNYFKHAVAADNRYYCAGQVACVRIEESAGSHVLALDTIYAVPFFAPRGGTVDRIGVACVQTGGTFGTSIRLGIYEATSDSNLYPGALVYDAGGVGVLDGDVDGPGFIAITKTLTAGKLYWLTILGDYNGTTAGIVRVLPLEAAWPILGYDATLTVPGSFISASQTYGPLPGTFPALGVIEVTDPPAIFLRFSA